MQPSDLCAGRFRLERSLGRGPSGAVYAATDVSTGQRCAVKRLHAQFHDDGTLRAVQRDALLAAQVAHPVIVAPTMTGTDEDGTFYLVSELVEGEPLRARLQRGPLSVAETLALFAPLCAALEAAHRAGLHHGDLTPANVLCPPGAARLTDFGMSRLGLGEGGIEVLWGGAAGYTPPEVYRGEVSVATARADVFALGVLLYECLSGQRLFDAPSAAALMFKACMAPVPSLASLLPPELDGARVDALLAMACDKDPEARFDHAGALWRAIQAVFTPGDEAARREVLREAPPMPVSLEVPLLDPVPATGEPELDAWAEQPPQAMEEMEPPVRPRYGRLALWAGAGGLAMAALLLVLSRLGPAVPAERAQVAAAAPAPPPPPPPAPPVPPAPDAALLQAEEKYEAGDYVAALAAAEELLQRAPQDPAAQALSRRAKEAMRHKAVYEGFLRAAERDDIDTAVALYRELPADSLFRQKAQEPFRKVRERFTETHLQIAGAAQRTGACEEVQRQVDLVIQISDDPASADTEKGRRLLARCRVAPAAPVREARPRPAPKAVQERPDPVAAEEFGELKNPFATRAGKTAPRP